MTDGSRHIVDADEASGRKEGARDIIRFWKEQQRVATFNADHVVAYGREGKITRPKSDMRSRYMVTLPPKIAEHGPTAFAVYADEMVLNERTRMYEFKFQGRRVVEIAQELVHQYMVDQARTPG